MGPWREEWCTHILKGRSSELMPAFFRRLPPSGKPSLIRKNDLPGQVLLLRYEPAVLPVSGADHWAWERQLGLKYSLAGSRTGAFAGSGAGAR